MAVKLFLQPTLKMIVKILAGVWGDLDFISGIIKTFWYYETLVLVFRKTKSSVTAILTGFINLIKKSTWYKNSNNLTKYHAVFTVCVLETGLSDFHLVTMTVLRKCYQKLLSWTVSLRSRKHFTSINENFSYELFNNLSKTNLVNIANCFEILCDIGFEAISKHHPSP